MDVLVRHDGIPISGVKVIVINVTDDIILTEDTNSSGVASFSISGNKDIRITTEYEKDGVKYRGGTATRTT
jgi:hypothetical protein